MCVITGFLLYEIYLSLDIRIWLNDNFVLLVNYMSDLATTASRKQAFGFEVTSTTNTITTNNTTKKES